MKKDYKKLIIKIGTNVITNDSGLLDIPVMEQIVNQVAQLKKQGIKIIIVSSGAMGAGRSLVKLDEKTDRIVKRQVLAAVGQVKLMEIYADLFSKHGYNCAQVLATKGDFGDRRHYLNMKNCFEALLRDDIIPVVNENDVVSVDELMFTDNDDLAGLIATMLNADGLFLLTSVEGIYRSNAEAEERVVISSVKFGEKNIEAHISMEKSLFGRGGMSTKCRIARKMAELGITTHIVNGRRKNVILDVIKKEAEIGTTFLPKTAKVSNVKRWIAYTEGQEKGAVYIDKGAENVLHTPGKAFSLLPVGIIKVEGEFEKGDVVGIHNETGKNIGYGLAQYDSKTAKEFMRKKGKKELIHYDYLFLNT
ncbi:MAG: glutamate 5-kinase [Patescibacteria group bacterium]